MKSIIFCTISFLMATVFNDTSQGSTGNSPLSFNSGLADTSKAFKRNATIGRGINFGNALEAPSEGEWGLVIKESYIQAIADAGFNSVRLPIYWPGHMENSYPYTIHADFLNRVDEITNSCLDKDLSVIITIHHFDSLYEYPDNQKYLQMLFAIWKQLTNHYFSYDHEHLFFEVLNEPELNLTDEKWNKLMPKLIDSIRVIDTDRTLIIDGPDYSTHSSLPKLIIPKSENNVIVSARYYDPYNFTHQGSWWSGSSMDGYLGLTWTGTKDEKEVVTKDLSAVKHWADSVQRPINVGEFGSIDLADHQSRLNWTNFVRTQIEKNGFSWCYFDFGVVFKAYSILQYRWLGGFLDALTGNSEIVTDGRISDSLMFSPQNPTQDDSIFVRSYITIPNLCSKTDSVRIIFNGSVINIYSYHTESIPPDLPVNSCADTIFLGKFVPGDYTIIFDAEYLDIENTVHYSITDTSNLHISDLTAVWSGKDNLLNIYPVPADQFLSIENMENNNHFQIYDLAGILRLEGITENRQINISGLSQGQYYLKIIENTGDQAVYTFLIIH